MTIEALTGTIELIRTLEEQIAERKAEVESLKAELVDFMKDNGLKTVIISKYQVSYTEYTSNRFDSTKFKAEHPDTYAKYLKATAATRLTISLKK